MGNSDFYGLHEVIFRVVIVLCCCALFYSGNLSFCHYGK